MNIKVCGITSRKQLEQLDGLDIEFAGFNFFKGSPRNVNGRILAKDLANIDLDIKKTGVFVNAGYDEIMKIVEEYTLDLVQLHGDETPALCEELSDKIEVIKAFRVSDTDMMSLDEQVADYDEVCDYYLFDSSSGMGYGGTGKKFDWQKIVQSKIEKPFFIGGGINPSDGPLLKAFRHPDFYGVDINSQFEKEPGIKDMGLILQFIHSMKAAG